MTTYTLEQLEILEMVAWADNPIATVMEARTRWRICLSEARYTLAGNPLDDTVGWILKDPEAAEGRASAILDALDEWIHAHAI